MELHKSEKPPLDTDIDNSYMPMWNSTLLEVIGKRGPYHNTSHDAFYPQLNLSWFHVDPDNPCAKPTRLCGQTSDWDKANCEVNLQKTIQEHQFGCALKRDAITRQIYFLSGHGAMLNTPPFQVPPNITFVMTTLEGIPLEVQASAWLAELSEENWQKLLVHNDNIAISNYLSQHLKSYESNVVVYRPGDQIPDLVVAFDGAVKGGHFITGLMGIEKAKKCISKVYLDNNADGMKIADYMFSSQCDQIEDNGIINSSHRELYKELIARGTDRLLLSTMSQRGLLPSGVCVVSACRSCADDVDLSLLEAAGKDSKKRVRLDDSMAEVSQTPLEVHEYEGDMRLSDMIATIPVRGRQAFKGSHAMSCDPAKHPAIGLAGITPGRWCEMKTGYKHCNIAKRCSDKTNTILGQPQAVAPRNARATYMTHDGITQYVDEVLKAKTTTLRQGPPIQQLDEFARQVLYLSVDSYRIDPTIDLGKYKFQWFDKQIVQLGKSTTIRGVRPDQILAIQNVWDSIKGGRIQLGVTHGALDALRQLHSEPSGFMTPDGATIFNISLVGKSVVARAFATREFFELGEPSLQWQSLIDWGYGWKWENHDEQNLILRIDGVVDNNVLDITRFVIANKMTNEEQQSLIHAKSVELLCHLLSKLDNVLTINLENEFSKSLLLPDNKQMEEKIEQQSEELSREQKLAALETYPEAMQAVIERDYPEELERKNWRETTHNRTIDSLWFDLQGSLRIAAYLGSAFGFEPTGEWKDLHAMKMTAKKSTVLAKCDPSGFMSPMHEEPSGSMSPVSVHEEPSGFLTPDGAAIFNISLAGTSVVARAFATREFFELGARQPRINWSIYDGMHDETPAEENLILRIDGVVDNNVLDIKRFAIADEMTNEKQQSLIHAKSVELLCYLLSKLDNVLTINLENDPRMDLLLPDNKQMEQKIEQQSEELSREQKLAALQTYPEVMQAVIERDYPEELRNGGSLPTVQSMVCGLTCKAAYMSLLTWGARLASSPQVSTLQVSTLRA